MDNQGYEKKRIYNLFLRQGSKVEAQLFLLTADFTLADWRVMRDDDYWRNLSLIESEYKKSVHTLGRVKQYLASRKNR